MPKRRCSFVIPAYNEALRLPPTLAAIAKLSASSLGGCEIIVADDGSTDFTADVALAFHAPQCHIRVLRLPHRGKGFAIRRGVSHATGDVVFLCDADLRDAVDEVLCLEDALQHGADIAIGSRWLDCTNHLSAQPFYRRASSRLFNLIAGRLLELPFKDTQCGLKALTRNAAARVFPSLSLDGWGYDAELIHVALALGLRVEEVGLRMDHDYRSSHFRPITDGWTVLMELFEIRWNDFRGAYVQAATEQPAVATLPSSLSAIPATCNTIPATAPADDRQACA